MKRIGIFLLLVNFVYDLTTACNDSQCPPHKPYCSDIGCLHHCPDTFYINGTTCVPECGDMVVVNHQTCKSACPEEFKFIRENIKTIGREIYIEKECILQCYLYEYEYNGFCLRECPRNATFLDGNTCFENCPAEKNIYDNFTTWGIQINYTRCVANCQYKFVENGNCVSTCADHKVIFNQSCVDQCPNSYPYISDQTCVDTCPQSSIHFQNGTCYKLCPSEKPFYWNNSCIHTCPDNFAITTYQNGVLHCVNACSDDLYLLNKSCVHTCPPHTFVYDITCVAVCPKTKPLIYKETITIMKCRVDCPPDMYVNNGTCEHSCPESLLTFNKTCVHQCPLSHALIEPKQITKSIGWKYVRKSIKECVAKCATQHVLYNTTCIDKCPDNYNYIWNGTCKTENCKTAYRYNTTAGINCTETCPDGRYLDANKNTCVETCQDNNVVYNKSCVASCPHDTSYILQRNNKGHCVKSCYMYIDERKCVSYCPPERKYHYNKTCVSQCPEAGQILIFRNKHNLECLTRCPDKYFVYNDSCTRKCPDNLTHIYNGKCSAACPSSIRFKEQVDSHVHCLASCPGNKLFQKGRCIPETDCKAIAFDGQCVSECPNTHFLLFTCHPNWVAILPSVVLFLCAGAAVFSTRQSLIKYFQVVKMIVFLLVKKSDFNIDVYERKLCLEKYINEREDTEDHINDLERNSREETHIREEDGERVFIINTPYDTDDAENYDNDGFTDTFL